MSMMNRASLTGIATALAASATVACAHPAPQAPAVATTAATATGHERDFEWLVGRWSVRHHRLKERLAHCTEWEDFAGTSTEWLTMGGLGTVDDNVIELPSGTYRAMGVRAFDPRTEEWLIWWHDGRTPTALDPPVRGGFKDGVGTFITDDTLRGKPIKVRFRWSKITPTSAHWEQAFSPDGGATWEVNWQMELTRVQ
jgi:hypothetical protein